MNFHFQPFITAFAAGLSAVFLFSNTASADPYLGEIRGFYTNWCPSGWLKADGALLSPSDHDALFSLLENRYGGNNFTTFALPDLRGRVPVAAGYGPGLSPVYHGKPFGRSSVQLTRAHLPEHRHLAPSSAQSVLNGSKGSPDTNAATGNMLSTFGSEAKIYVSEPTATAPFAEGTIQTSVTTEITTTGDEDNAPIELTQPSFGLTYCIAIKGVYPPRD